MALGQVARNVYQAFPQRAIPKTRVQKSVKNSPSVVFFVFSPGLRSIDLIYLDLSKVVDSVNHRLLLANRSGNGITLIVLIWVESFQVNVNGALYQTAEAIIGVPHSVIGPILFVSYVKINILKLLQ